MKGRRKRGRRVLTRSDTVMATRGETRRHREAEVREGRQAVSVSVSLTIRQHRDLRLVAALLGVPMSLLLRDAVDQALPGWVERLEDMGGALDGRSAQRFLASCRLARERREKRSGGQ